MKVVYRDYVILPSFSIAMIKTMNGAKSNFQIKAINMKPNCQNNKLKNQ